MVTKNLGPLGGTVPYGEFNMTRIKINNNSAEIVGEEFYTSGMVGAKIAFQFSEEWNGLTKTAVFRTDHLQKDVLNVTNVCTIPHECLEKAGERLVVGVYGTNGNDIVIPTIYVSLGRIKQGADPSGDVSADPSLPVWAQVQEAIGNLSQIETETKDSLVAAINEVKQTADSKQDTISDLEAIRSGAAKGATALQSVPNTYRTASEQDTIDSGKVDKVTGKGLSSNDYTDAAKAKVDALAPVATSGSYNDLTNKPTIPIAYDDTEVRQRIGAIEAKESTWDAKSNFSGSYNDLTDKPTIPAPITEQTVSGWGFTKNTGTYSKPAGGIPKADLVAAVQTSLGKADTALQEHQSLAAYRTAAAQDVIDSGKQDKITSTNKLAYSLISGTPTIPTVPTNVSAFTNDAGYLTLATLPKYEGVVE